MNCSDWLYESLCYDVMRVRVCVSIEWFCECTTVSCGEFAIAGGVSVVCV